LTEAITISEGSNYFCILNDKDFEERVANEFAAAFIPTVKNMELLLTTKHYKVTGIYGSGKEGPISLKDESGWEVGNQHLFGEKVQTTVGSLNQMHMPNDMVKLIVNEANLEQEKPIIISKENSCFPSPTPEKPGYMKGGWIIISLEPTEDKGDVKGYIRFECRATLLDDKIDKFIKDVDLSGAEQAMKEGKKNWASSEGMEKALVLQQFVFTIKTTLDLNVNAPTPFPQEFLDWFDPLVEKFTLPKEKEIITALKSQIIVAK